MLPAPRPQALPALTEDRDHAAALAAASLSSSTLTTYRREWRRWERWATGTGAAVLPAEAAQVATWLAGRHRQGAKPATLRKAASALSTVHELAGHPSPCRGGAVGRVLSGAARTSPRSRGSEPLLLADLRPILQALPLTLRGQRDRAILLLGWAGALRRSELAAVDVDHLVAHEEGILLYLPSSKTDQEGDGAHVGIPYGRGDLCPVRAVREWQEAAGLDGGPLFRAVRGTSVAPERLSGRSVWDTVRRAANGAGLELPGLGAHSLRVGFATEAAAQGAGEREIMRHGRWRSVTVARRYIRRGSAFRDNPAARLL